MIMAEYTLAPVLRNSGGQRWKLARSWLHLKLVPTVN
jgi:hypothetical protein